LTAENHSLQEEDQAVEAEGSSLTPNTRKRASKRGTAVVETQVRRSTRRKDANKGFKSNGCTDKKCLACAPDPPIIKNEVIKKLAFDFCNLDEAEINDDLL
jgi:hypothetical protein